MRVFQGRGKTPESDMAFISRLLEQTKETEEPSLRVWRPHRTVVFGRQDTNHEQYEQARELARKRDCTPLERSVGGNAVAYTGNTIAVAQAVPVVDGREGITERYATTGMTLRNALRSLGVSVRQDAPAHSFCPGTNSLSAEGKIAGIAQRVRSEVAMVSAIVIVRDHEEIADILAPIYETLDIPFETDTVGSIANAGGESDPAVVRNRIEDAFSPGDQTIESLRET